MTPIIALAGLLLYLVGRVAIPLGFYVSGRIRLRFFPGPPFASLLDPNLRDVFTSSRASS